MRGQQFKQEIAASVLSKMAEGGWVQVCGRGGSGNVGEDYAETLLAK